MNTEHVWEMIAILATAFLAWWSRRSGDREQDERKAREAQAARLGERIGVLERRADIELGRRLGAAAERKRRGGDGR